MYFSMSHINHHSNPQVSIDKEVAALSLLNLSKVSQNNEVTELSAKRTKLVRQDSTDDNSEVQKGIYYMYLLYYMFMV